MFASLGAEVKNGSLQEEADWAMRCMELEVCRSARLSLSEQQRLGIARVPMWVEIVIFLVDPQVLRRSEACPGAVPSAQVCHPG